MKKIPRARALNNPSNRQSKDGRKRLRQSFLAGQVSDLRLNRLLADYGVSSRRGADSLIEAGEVLVNGEPAVLGQKVNLTDSIIVRGRPLRLDKEKKYIYLLLYKPRGITCTTDLRRRDNIITYLNLAERVFPVGRLDRDSEGLILLTNDGGIVNPILRVENGHEKEYIVTLDRAFDENFLKTMAGGVKILGQMTLPCKVKQLSARSFTIVLQQGLNRQIRRMCETLGYEVKKLCRTRIIFLNKGSMKAGDYRYLEQDEEAKLLNLLANAKRLN